MRRRRERVDRPLYRALRGHRRTPDLESLQVVEDPARAAAILDPLRRRLVSSLVEAPDSATGLARRLGESRQRLNYHLRELEKSGFLELVEERRKGNCVERILRATARHYLIDPRVLGELSADAERVQDRFSSAYLIALAARAIRELAPLRERARKAGKRLATFSLDTEVRLARPADLEVFTAELAGAVARVVARHHDEEAPQGRGFRVVLGAYPASSEADS